MIVPASPAAYRDAARELARGRLVALPTETVYGLAADARDGGAVRAVYALKGRPASNPLITHITRPGQADDYGVMTPVAQALAGRFWPGPLTLVVERRASNLASPLAPDAHAGLPTIALRCPDAPWREAVSGPLVMPSANRSGHVSPTRADHVAHDFGDGLMVVDAGPCPGGIESTVVRCFDTRAHILRPGAVPEADIAKVARLGAGEAVGSPGLLLKHYAPAAPVRLNAREARPGEVMLGYGGVRGDIALGDTPEEAARALYAALREADARGAQAIAVAPVPETGLGVAVNDRLRRAARGR